VSAYGWIGPERKRKSPAHKDIGTPPASFALAAQLAERDGIEVDHDEPGVGT
jgi:hypothetical protein